MDRNKFLTGPTREDQKKAAQKAKSEAASKAAKKAAKAKKSQRPPTKAEMAVAILKEENHRLRQEISLSQRAQPRDTYYGGCGSRGGCGG